MIERRQFLRYGLGCAAGAAVLRGATSPMSGSSLFADVQNFWRFGGHRTATEADEKTTTWLLGELRKAGFETSRQSFTLRQFFADPCFVTVNGEKIPVEPLFPVAGETEVTGPIGSGIVAVSLPADSGGAMSATSPGLKLIRDAADAGAKAVILITEGPTGQVIQQNDESETKRWPIPVALVAPKFAKALEQGKTATLSIRGKVVEQAKASNAQGFLKRGKDVIVVSTPKSGWFRCGGERGPGVALWLGIARSVGRRKDGPSYLFTANSGHELHGLGMKAFLGNGAPKPAEVACWVHFGAGIATYGYSSSGKILTTADSKRYLTCSPDVGPVIAPAFAAMPELAPITSYQLGELRYLVAAGYRGFSIAAGHRLHHTPIDDPSSTGGDILEPIGRAFSQAFQLVEGHRWSG